MPSLASHSLSRTSSMSSVGSDDSIQGGDAQGSSSISVDVHCEAIARRTRKRFTSVQLIVLEHLYRKASHPTREQREAAAREAEIDLRSVTIWFQNKRQSDRRNLQLSEPLSRPSSSPAPSMPLPPSSPFSDASGNTIHTVRARTRTLSGNSSISAASAMSATTASRKRDREHDAASKAVSNRHVRHKPSRQFSLDDIAARSERPLPALGRVPYTPPQLQYAAASPCSGPSSSSSPARPRTPEARGAATAIADVKDRALWENMPSSPERDLVRYGSRRITLEYACAREMVGSRQPWERVKPEKETYREKEKEKGRKKKVGSGHAADRKQPKTGAARPSHTVVRESRKEVDEDDEVPVAEWDVHGDTDTEGVVSEAPVTPSSSFGFGELSVIDEKQAMPHKEDPPVQVEGAHGACDEDMMHAAQRG
ncbi:hypothetical protein C8Q80DRAFT_1215248 [Daedaleopsis nitida]|nr:hypothetical protein C8Q80DRAFT_1215248 [Daedaleopsis nitida]